MEKKKVFSKKYKIFACITLFLCINYVAIDKLLTQNQVGLRLTYYNVLISSFLFPVIFLLIWSFLLLYKKFFRKNVILKIIGSIWFTFLSFGFLSMAILGILTSQERTVQIDGIRYVYSSNSTFEPPYYYYYEVQNEFLYKIPYKKRVENTNGKISEYNNNKIEDK